MQDQTLGLAALGIQGTKLTSLTDKDEASAIYKRLDAPDGDICLLYGASYRNAEGSGSHWAASRGGCVL